VTPTTDDTSTDVDNDDFTASSANDELDNDTNADIMNICNNEVSSIQTYHVLFIGIDTLQIVDMLPSKTMPEVNTKKQLTHALKQKAVKVGRTVPPKKKARACGKTGKCICPQ
jgi:hypothetical protein